MLSLCSWYWKGDEVILPSFTYFATAEVVINAGATPVFADVELDTYCISLEKILPLVTKNTKCIIPVHLYGNNADIETSTIFVKKIIYICWRTVRNLLDLKQNQISI